MDRLPTDEEVRQFAVEIGAVDAAGGFTEPREKLVRGTVHWLDNLADEQVEQGATTAGRLKAFHDEIAEQFSRPAAWSAVLAAIPALINREGLNTKGTRTHG